MATARSDGSLKRLTGTDVSPRLKVQAETRPVESQSDSRARFQKNRRQNLYLRSPNGTDKEKDSRKPIRGPRGVRSLAYLALFVSDQIYKSRAEYVRCATCAFTRGVSSIPCF